jgi:hypothetical protein
MSGRFAIGDYVIFRVTKFSSEPGPRAQSVHPARFGDTYNYEVDKFWTVRAILDTGTLELVTRRGKVHLVSPEDPRLRKANFWEVFLNRKRFPSVKSPASAGTSSQSSTKMRQSVTSE